MADRFLSLGVYASALLIFMALLGLLGDVVLLGFANLSWDFIVQNPLDSGRQGGIASILVSTAFILFIAMGVAVPLGLAVAVWLAEFSPKTSRFAGYTGISLDVLAGVPSIVYGLFGNAFFCVYLGLGFSIVSGGLTLACMVLPVFVRTCEIGIRSVRNDWRHGADALGLSKISALIHILIPAARPAIVAGLILGIGRATAETAALLYTSGYVDRMPESVLDSGRALSVHIYDLSMNVTGGDAQAYTAALVLVVLIVVLNGVAQGLLDHWLKTK